MRRSVAIFLWILIGGLSSGLSVGFFLYKSNLDRATLVLELSEARAQAEAALQSSENVAADANKKIHDAERAMAKLRDQLNHAKTETLLIASAVPLSPPPPRLLRNWNEQLSIPLGITIKTPPDIKTQTSDHAIILGPASSRNGDAMDQRVTVTRYRNDTEKDLISRLRETAPVVFTISGRWLYGTKGKFADLPGEVTVLRAQSGQTDTHLIWARTDKDFTERRLQDILSTLRFQS